MDKKIASAYRALLSIACLAIILYNTQPVYAREGTGTSCVFILPERGIGIAVTANVNDYFVTNGMMDTLDWGTVSMLLGETPSVIGEDTYLWDHLWIDLLMLALFSIAVLPLCRLPRYAHRTEHRRGSLTVLSLLSLHLFLPIFILSLVPVFFETPLWVAQAFVPDVFITVVVSSTSLFIGGLLKTILFYRYTRSRSDQL